MAVLEPGIDLMYRLYGVADKGNWKKTPKSNVWNTALKFLQSGTHVDFSFSAKEKKIMSLVKSGTINNCRAPEDDVVFVFFAPEMENVDSGSLTYGGFRLKYLNQAAAELGMDIDGWRLTSLHKWFDPTDKYPAEWLKSGKHLLDIELRNVLPGVVVLCGAAAVEGWLGNGAKYERHYGQITKHRGEDGDFDIICIPDPLDCENVPTTYDDFRHGMAKLKEYLECTAMPSWAASERGLIRRETRNAHGLRAILNDVLVAWQSNPREFALDAEWHGRQPCNKDAYLRCLQFSYAPKTGVVVVLGEAGGKKNPQFDEIMGVLDDFLWEQRPTLVGHYLTADMQWLTPNGLTCLPELWEKDGFDTGLAAHSICETQRLKLEYLAHKYLGVPRYDYPLKDWLGIAAVEGYDDNGYGEVPDAVLYPYGAYDADVTLRLKKYFETPLDKDSYGLNCRPNFNRKMKASLAVLEINSTGLTVDRKRLDELTLLYLGQKDKLLKELRKELKWPRFNPESSKDKIEFLFGEKYTPRKRPVDALSLYCKPLYTTGDYPIPWDDVVDRGSASEYTPAVDTDVLGAISSKHPIVKKLLHHSYVCQVLKTAIREPSRSDSGEFLRDENGFLIYPPDERSAPGSISDDGKLRTHMYPTLETGRWASSRPNLQNWSGTREVDYKAILGKEYVGSLRSIIVSSPGYTFVEGDYSGAEVAIAAFQSDDPRMISDVADPTKDMHSEVAVMAFGLDCPPTKKGLQSIGKEHYRHLAKMVFFGLMYGRGAKAIAVQANAMGLDVTPHDAQQVIDSIFKMYPRLHYYLEQCFMRAESPRWISTCFQSYRRVPRTLNTKVLAAYGRQFKNFPEQGAVADVVNCAAYEAIKWRRESGVDFRIVLQIHDALMFEVNNECLDYFVKSGVPEFMCNRVPIFATDLNGIPTGKEYRLKVGVKTFTRWGE